MTYSPKMGEKKKTEGPKASTKTEKDEWSDSMTYSGVYKSLAYDMPVFFLNIHN